MVVVGQFLFGLLLVVGGVLVAIDHPVVDWLNRWMKASGTTQRPEEIEMNENAAIVGFLIGSFTVIVGLVALVDAFT